MNDTEERLLVTLLRIELGLAFNRAGYDPQATEAAIRECVQRHGDQQYIGVALKMARCDCQEIMNTQQSDFDTKPD